METHQQRTSEVTPYLAQLNTLLFHSVKIIPFFNDPSLVHYSLYYKERLSSAKYLFVIVKYLNNEGFIITACLRYLYRKTNTTLCRRNRTRRIYTKRRIVFKALAS